jgi:hypothetical protein
VRIPLSKRIALLDGGATIRKLTALLVILKCLMALKGLDGTGCGAFYYIGLEFITRTS